jgi:type I restriction enzyme S subunit
MKKTFDEVFEDKTKYGTKIKTDEYHTKGKYLIIDQGQEEVAGYTDLEEGVFTDVPAIIFGDHTRTIKYVDEPFFLGADGVKVLKSKFKDANYKYLYYVLKNAKIPNTGYNRHFKWLKEVSIEYPNPARQAYIVTILDKVTRLIDARQRELAQLDTLIKARFVEMFGDPVDNPNGWKCQSLDSICENLDNRRVPISSHERKAGVYPYYGASGIVDYVDDYIFDEDLLLISEDGANLVMRSTPIAFSVSGKVWVNNHAHVVRFKSRAMQKYIEVCFALIDISSSITGSAQPKLNQEKLNAMMFCIPPIELQNQFADFVTQVDKSKVAVQRALDETQLLFDSLMQEYFG